MGSVLEQDCRIVKRLLRESGGLDELPRGRVCVRVSWELPSMVMELNAGLRGKEI